MKLEVSLHIQLVERPARGVTLTEAGARLYEHACRGIDWLTEGETAVRTGQSELGGAENFYTSNVRTVVGIAE